MRRKRKPVILILDDQAGERAPVRRLLELDGYSVIEAASAQEATEQFEKKHPALAIVDVKLIENIDPPDLSGILWITTLPETFPVIVYSTYKEPEVWREALQHRKNVYAFINKQESVETLRANVKSALLEAKPDRPSMWARVLLFFLFAIPSAAFSWYYWKDFWLAIVAAVIVGALVEIIRLFF
jgi:DNA-binding NtrC family response regulator